MGKASTRKQTRRDKLANSQTEGTITVSFVFDGKYYGRQHQMRAGEIAHMKELCREHGDAAADQVIWKMAVRYSGFFAENVVALAGKEYCDRNYLGPKGAAWNVFSEAAAPVSYQDLIALEESSTPEEPKQ